MSDTTPASSRQDILDALKQSYSRTAVYVAQQWSRGGRLVIDQRSEKATVFLKGSTFGVSYKPARAVVESMQEDKSHPLRHLLQQLPEDQVALRLISPEGRIADEWDGGQDTLGGLELQPISETPPAEPPALTTSSPNQTSPAMASSTITLEPGARYKARDLADMTGLDGRSFGTSRSRLDTRRSSDGLVYLSNLKLARVVLSLLDDKSIEVCFTGRDDLGPYTLLDLEEGGRLYGDLDGDLPPEPEEEPELAEEELEEEPEPEGAAEPPQQEPPQEEPPPEEEPLEEPDDEKPSPESSLRVGEIFAADEDAFEEEANEESPSNGQQQDTTEPIVLPSIINVDFDSMDPEEVERVREKIHEMDSSVLRWYPEDEELSEERVSLPLYGVDRLLPSEEEDHTSHSDAAAEAFLGLRELFMDEPDPQVSLGDLFIHLSRLHLTFLSLTIGYTEGDIGAVRAELVEKMGEAEEAMTRCREILNTIRSTLGTGDASE